MNYSVAETSIVERLGPLAAEFSCEVLQMPSTQAEYKTPTGPFVWVSYERSKFDQTNDDPRLQSSGPTIQKEVMQFQITFNAKTLRGEKGIHVLMAAARLLLVGFKPTNCHKLYMIEVTPEKFEENLWTYKMVMGCQSVVMELDGDDDEVGAEITRIRLENTDFNEIVEAP